MTQVYVESTVPVDATSARINVVLVDEQAGRKEPASIVVPFASTLTQVKRRLQALSDQWAAGDSFVKLLAPGLLDTATDPDVPADPTPKAQFITSLGRLTTALRYVDLGILAADDATISALRDEVKQLYDPAFISPF